MDGGAAGGKSILLPLIIAGDTGADRVVDKPYNKPGIDLLLNAAGHIATGTIEDTSMEGWDAMLNINLRAVFTLPKAVPSSH